MLKLDAIGHLGQDAIASPVEDKVVINFSIAHNERPKKDQKHGRTVWIRCALWQREETKLTDYLKKGQLVYVSGYPKVFTYTNKELETVAGLELVVDSVELLGKKPEKESDSHQGQASTADADSNDLQAVYDQVDRKRKVAATMTPGNPKPEDFDHE
jgi:single-strand DNA-binding protein